MTLEKKQAMWGWVFVLPASLLIVVFSFYPMVQAFWLSLQSGLGNNLKFVGFANYFRLFEDELFKKSVGNVFIYLIIQVPIMLFLALMLASMLNNTFKGKTIFRMLAFLPCTVALVSTGLIFRSFFSVDGFVNAVLLNLHLIKDPIMWLTDSFWARFVIILAITWRWTGYNVIFYLAGLQSIDHSVYEAAKLDGASPLRQFFTITIPLLKPVILFTAIMSTNGTLQLFDEVNMISSVGLESTITISQHLYAISFRNVPQLGYAAAISYAILILVAILAFIQMKLGDKE